MNIHHVWADTSPPNPETDRRVSVARVSWERRYRCGLYRTPGHSSTRLSEDGCPYIRDIMAPAVAVVKPDDIILLTNADVGVAEGFTEALVESIRKSSAVYLRRREFPRIDWPPTAEEVLKAPVYPGGDAFAFSAAWWFVFGITFPDMVLGRYGWDSCMKNLIRRGGGTELHGYLFHETHASAWNATPEAIESLPGNVHNKRLLLEWIEKYGGHPEDHLFTFNELRFK